MNFRLIDSHAHVQFAAYDADRPAVVSRAEAAGIGIINIGTQYSTSADAIKLAEAYPDDLWATIGFHPNHANLESHHDLWELREKKQENFDISKFRNIALRPKVVAVGECGLDYYRGDRGQGVGDSVKERQKDIFIQQIELAKEIKKPLVIHCREAFGDLIPILSANPYSLTPHGNGVVHFFSGSWEDAEKLLGLGFYLSFGGVLTFVYEYDEVVKKVPLNRLLIETDAPYVSPAPYRGKRNEPAYVIEVAKKIAELHGITLAEVAVQTTDNVKRLFEL